jgi:xanthine dehydrogenase YagT iron-sulfur-binding subunit
MKPARENISRRDFVNSAAALTSGIAVGLPPLAKIEGAAPIISSGPEQVALTLVVNGLPHQLAIDSRTSLLDVLRERIGLTGTKKGCDRGQCGACTVLANGRRINSCLSLAVVHEGDAITTIEGLAGRGQLHPVQEAFLEHDGFQCGYCTPGQICSAVALLEEWKRGEASAVNGTGLSRDEIRERMSGNICRCGAYTNIVAAIEAAYRNGSHS